jgi:hypothetical protein
MKLSIVFNSPGIERAEPKPGPERRRHWFFWRNVQAAPNGCWEWKGATGDSGFGRFRASGRELVSPHVWVYEQFHGEVPDGKWVVRSCENVACVHPLHVQLSTRRQRRLDAILGNRAPTVRLTPEKAREIRRRYAAGERNLSELARGYQVSRQAVADLVRGRTWTWIEDPGPTFPYEGG